MNIKKNIKKVKRKKPTKKALSTVDRKKNELLPSSDVIFNLPQELIQKHIDYTFGRPISYDPKMCVELIIHMAQGRTFKDACTLMGISNVTAWHWVKEPTEDNPNEYFKPDFFKSFKIGECLSELWWNDLGKANLNNPKFNNTLYMMFRQNMHGWTRRVDGKLEVDTTTHNIEEKRTVVEHILNISGDESVAEIARILVESGAVKSDTQKIISAETH